MIGLAMGAAFIAAYPLKWYRWREGYIWVLA